MKLSCRRIQRVCTHLETIRRLLDNLEHVFDASLPVEVEQAKQVLKKSLVKHPEIFSPYWGNDPYRPYRNSQYRRIGIAEAFTDDPFLAIYLYLEEPRVLSLSFIAEELSRLLNKKHLLPVRTLRIIAGPSRYTLLEPASGELCWFAMRAFHHFEGPPKICPTCNNAENTFIAEGYYFIAFCTGTGDTCVQADWLLVQVLS